MFWQVQYLTYFDMVGVGADSGFVGVVNLVPLGSVAVVVFSNFRKRVAANYGVRITSSSLGLAVTEEIGTRASSGRLGRLNGLFIALISQKIE